MLPYTAVAVGYYGRKAIEGDMLKLSVHWIALSISLEVFEMYDFVPLLAITLSAAMDFFLYIIVVLLNEHVIRLGQTLDCVRENLEHSCSLTEHTLFTQIINIKLVFSF